MYKEKRSAQSAFIPIRSLRYHLLQWTDGPVQPELPPLVLVHGWMDVGASYQFMVDALSPGFTAGRRIIAPDWRGFGKTQAQTDNFWFPDYLADLDFLLDAIAPGQAVDLVGHSMGGNIALCYAGVRPQRIRRAVNLEGFGLAASRPSQAPGRYGQWMDEIKSLYAGELGLRSYPDAQAVAGRLMKTNPRLSQDKAQWLALHWARPDAQGLWHILGEAAHKIKNPYLYRWDEMQEIWKRITAPVLSVVAGDDSLNQWWKGSYTLADYHERLKNITQVHCVRIEDAGHMLHHDQPQVLAQAIETFLA
ncbi:MAG: alpha/beta fold hydrolase [Betaproteobacteria bacterium]